MKKFRRQGNISKATTGEDGSLHLVVLASGPELDKSGERPTAKALDQLEETAKAGKIRLVPSHDTPITLGKSVDAFSDAEGHRFIDFELSKENSIAVQLHGEVSKGEWTDRQVSVGGKAAKSSSYDPETKKSAVDITAWDINHVALTFPDHGVYQKAALTEALVKAFKSKDLEALKSAGISEEEIKKAYDADGNWIPSTFAARWAAEKMDEELPDMLDCLRWNIESIMWVDDPTTKRALLAKTFSEFTAIVLGEATAEPTTKAQDSKSEDLAELKKALKTLDAKLEEVMKTFPFAAPAAPSDPPVDPPAAGHTQKAEGDAAPPEVPPPSEGPPAPVVVNKSIPDTTPDSAAAVSAPEPSAKEVQKTKKEALRKSIENESDPLKRANLVQQMNALSAQEGVRP